MLVTIFRKILDFISGFLNAILYRIDRKKDNPRGYRLGGPKKARWKGALLLFSILATAFGAILIKQGVLIPMADHFDRETAPGAKIPTNISSSVTRNDLLQLEMSTGDGSAKVDCNRIIANLKIRGTLTERERIDYERACKNFLSREMQDVIDKIISGEIPSNVAADVMESLNEDNAKDILNALNNEEIKKALRSESGSTIARSLSDLGKLKGKELDLVVKAIRNAPPQFRQDVVDAVKSTIALENPDARAALIRSIGQARSREELKDLKEFADTLHEALPDEQKIFAEAYEKAPDLETRKALHRAAKEIVQIDQDDPVRAKFVSLIKQVADMPADQQKNAYNKFADVAKVYRTTDDPELKKAIGDAIMAASSPHDIIALAERLEALQKAMKAGEVSKDDQIAVIGGHDQELIDRVMAAAELMDSGDVVGAKKAIEGALSSAEIAQALKRASEKKLDPFSPKSRSSGPATKEKLEEMLKLQKALQERKARAERKIGDYLTAGISPGDPRLIELYKEMADADREFSDLSGKISDLKSQLRQRLLELRSKAQADFAEAGIAFPEIDIKIPDETVVDNAPDERFTNLVGVKEFWSTEDGSYHKSKNRYFKFDAGGINGGSVSGNTLLGSATSKLGPNEIWYSDGFSGGNQGTNSAVREFEMSRTLYVPGILKRIPSGGIPTKAAGQTTILFEFIQSVVNRKTQRVEIPAGSVAICKVKDFENDTGRLNATCNTVDVGGREDIRVNLVLGDASGADGAIGKIVDDRGWQLAGIFLTAFSASVLDGLTQQFVTPFETKAEKAAADFVMAGAGGGASSILQDVAAKQIDDWSNANTFWVGYDGMLATIKQSSN